MLSTMIAVVLPLPSVAFLSFEDFLADVLQL